jgi:hypothetical protein
MSTDDVTRAKAIRIEDVVTSAGLTLVKKSNNHTTKEHDSLVLFSKTNSWYWYQQGVGGDVIAWVQHTQNVDFKSAIDWLLQRPNSLSPYGSVLINQVPRDVAPPSLSPSLPVRMHHDLGIFDYEWWFKKGVGEDAVRHFVNGVYQHPIHGTCYSIPVTEDGTLVNIRLRLAHAKRPADKYRPYDAGRGTHLFNCDILTEKIKGVVVVAGEIKAEVLYQFDIPAVSPTAGCGHWRPEWCERLRHCRTIYIAYDPGEEVAGARLAEEIGKRARFVTLPAKPDDFIIEKGEKAFRYHLRHALPIAEWRKTLKVKVSETIAAALYEGSKPIVSSTDCRVPWRRQLWRK